MLVLVSGLVLVLGSGCVYFMDRGNDFVDMFGVRLTGNFGWGLEANVRATELFQTGIGWSEKYAIGFNGRHYGTYKEQSYTLPFTPSDWVPWIYPTPIANARAVKREPILGNFPAIDSSRHIWLGYPSDVAFTKDGEPTKYDRRYDEIGFSVYALIIGVEAEVRLVEIFDFVLGIFTIDMMGDDQLRKPKQPKKEYGTKNPAVKKLIDKKEQDKKPEKKAPSLPKKPPAKTGPQKTP
jgi:hypothetical protein